MPSTPAPLAPSPPAGPTKEHCKQDRNGTRELPRAERPIAAGISPPAAAASAPLSAATPPRRAPLPTKQPRADTSTAKGTGGPQPSPLSRPSAPSTSSRMAMASIVSPVPTAEMPKISMTSKEWVIPPRPKPGRKPATDTPPTKRKAQNRAAQRAFRERRAARVGELEQQLDEIRDAHQKDEDELKDKIRSLELDLQSFRSRCMLLENMLERERQERIRAETQAESLRRRQSDDFFRSHSISSPGMSHGPPQRSSSRQMAQPGLSEGLTGQQAQGRNISISQIITPPEGLGVNSSNHDADAAITCGGCTPDGPCACAAEVLAASTLGCGKCSFGASCQCLNDMAAQDQGQTAKRPASPSAVTVAGKRQKSRDDTAPVTEIDFTAMFSRKPIAQVAPQPPLERPSFNSDVPPGESIAFKESCGFCKDGTYCVCAEDAAGMATPAMTPTEIMAPASRQTQTPPPSEPETMAGPMAVEMTADGSVKLPRRIAGKKPVKASASDAASSSTTGSCGASGPGTCAQCQADPKSGLFCRLMNAKYSREQGSTSDGCCGGKGAGAGCCKSNAAPEKITLPSLPSLGLSCAEAYQTLSSHRNFSKAADDISSWLPKLKTTANAASRGPAPGRQAIEVEAASIMSVLKEFDVRFGREA